MVPQGSLEEVSCICRAVLVGLERFLPQIDRTICYREDVGKQEGEIQEKQKTMSTFVSSIIGYYGCSSFPDLGFPTADFLLGRYSPLA